MKKSQYKFLYMTDDGNRIAFNATTCALAVVEDEFINLLSKIDTTKEDDLTEKEWENTLQMA